MVASRFAEAGSAAITAGAPGRIMVADILPQGTTLDGENELLHLRFEILDPSANSRVEIVDLTVSDGSGRINRLAGKAYAEIQALPEAFSLGRNYPNPFNPQTAIPFAVPKPGEVRVAVYNALGQQITVLAEGQREAGYHRLVWDGRDSLGREAASGIYFVSMSAEGFSAVQRMMLLK